MKKLALFVAAFVLTLGLAQCKKEQTPANTASEGVFITLNVGSSTGSGTDGSRVQVNPDAEQQVTFTNEDRILVASGGHYVGYLEHNGSGFSGTITNPTAGQKLYFYFLGNKADIAQLTAGSSTNCTVNISDQMQELPVISMAPSNETYPSEGNAYSATLLNQCALVEFTTNEIPTTTAVTISGMKNMVTVNFNGNTLTPSEERGTITLHNTESTTKRWAILLPDDEVETTAIAEGYYESDNFTVPPVAINGYLHGENGASLELYTPRTMPLTFEAKNANVTVKLMKNVASAPEVYLEYSTDGITWNNFSPSSGVTLSNIGDKVMFRASTPNSTFGGASGRDPLYNHFQISDECFVYGNIISLLDKTSYATSASFGSNTYVFWHLFDGCDKLYNHNVKSLLLPATTLTDYCYSNMFNGCTSLTKAPELTAQELGQYCYSNMFKGCTSLTDVPDLPATTLKRGSYSYMFSGCTSLTEAPELSATTLDQFCCRNMFDGCTSLITAPTLLATTLIGGCYYYMFNGCSSLNSITCLATGNTASYLNNWVYGVASSGTFTKASNASYSSGSSGIPNGWTVINQ